MEGFQELGEKSEKYDGGGGAESYGIYNFPSKITFILIWEFIKMRLKKIKSRYQLSQRHFLFSSLLSQRMWGLSG